RCTPSDVVGPRPDAPEDRIEVGVAIVGGGPAGLACAIKLMQLLENEPELTQELGEGPGGAGGEGKTTGGALRAGAGGEARGGPGGGGREGQDHRSASALGGEHEALGDAGAVSGPRAVGVA